MTDLEVIPDGGAVFLAWASAVPELTEIVDDRISLTLAGTKPAIRYSVVSDAAGAYGEGLPLVLAQCWGTGGGVPDDGTASRLARTLAAAVTGPGGLPASIEQGPYTSNDPTTGRPRWLVGIRLNTFA